LKLIILKIKRQLNFLMKKKTQNRMNLKLSLKRILGVKWTLS